MKKQKLRSVTCLRLMKESYVLDEHEYTLLLSRDGETYELGIVNFKIRGQIKVIKTECRKEKLLLKL